MNFRFQNISEYKLQLVQVISFCWLATRNGEIILYDKDVTILKRRHQDGLRIGDTSLNRPKNSLKCHNHCTKSKFVVKTATLENCQELGIEFLNQCTKTKFTGINSVTCQENNQIHNGFNEQHESEVIYAVTIFFLIRLCFPPILNILIFLPILV